MSEPAKKLAAYDDLYNIPENMTGEIIDGELVASPRPSSEHINASSNLGAEIIPPYRFGRGGPGGWIIHDEPEIAFGQNVLVPDLAGWKKERFFSSKDHNWITVIPDWVCEIISPCSVRTDRMKKMRIYAQYNVPYIWIIDPIQMMLEVYKLEAERWVLIGVYGENDKVRAEPFQEIEINLANLWLEEQPKPPRK